MRVSSNDGLQHKVEQVVVPQRAQRICGLPPRREEPLVATAMAEPQRGTGERTAQTKPKGEGLPTGWSKKGKGGEGFHKKRKEKNTPNRGHGLKRLLSTAG